MDITTSNVVFNCNGHSITNNGTAGYTYGIMLFSPMGPISNVTVENCPSISGYSYGVYGGAFNGSVISNVTAHNNAEEDFDLGAGDFTALVSDTSYGSPYGFYLSGCSDSNITGNVAHDDSQYDFFVDSNSNHNSITNNIAYDSVDGFLLQGGYIDSTGNRLASNIAYDNSQYGFYISGASSSTLAGNTAYNNSAYQAYVTASPNSFVYNNVFNATGSQGVAHDDGADSWNKTEDCSNRNIVGGSCTGGNWYSDYAGVCTDGSGIGNTTYPVPGGPSVDYLPLTNRGSLNATALNVTTSPAGTLDASTVSGIAGYCGITPAGPGAYAINYTWFVNGAANASGAFSSLTPAIMIGTAGKAFAYDSGFTNPANANDGNYSTKASYTAFSSASFYWNYTNPANSTNVTLWQTKHGKLATSNVTLPAACADRATIQLRITANNSNSSTGSQQLSASANGGTFANDTSVGSLSWANPRNANSSDAIYAIATSPGNGSQQQTVYLKVTNFGFSIPAGATITGIQARIDKNTNSTTANDTGVYLVKDGAIGGTNHQNASAWPQNSEITALYGSSTDLWGAQWSPGDIDNASSGIAFSASRMTGTGSRVLEVDYVNLTVYYSTATTTNYSQTSKFCYNGSSWVSVGTDSTATNDFTAADVYDQDVYFSISNSSSSGTNYLVNNLTTSFADGQSWIFQCTATDGTTTWNQNASAVVLAYVPPPLAVTLNSPASGALLGSSTAAFYFTATDNTTQAMSCSIFLDNVLNQNNPSVANNTVTVFNVSGMADGSHSWYVQCTDSANNTAKSVTSNFTVDTTAPAVTLNSPPSGALLNYSTIAFSFTATDALSSTTSCALFRDGSQIGSNASVQRNTTTIISASTPDGAHTWYVSCNDSAGNTGTSATRNLTVDTTAPIVSLNSPANASAFNTSTVAFNFTAIDNLAPVMSCSIFLDGVLKQTNSSTANNTAAIFNISGLANGNHAWYVQCKDNANNSGASATRSFTVNVSSPGQWANASLDRCRNITIASVSGSSQANFPAVVNLAYDSDMQANYSDLRFYNASCNNGGTLLPYEIENYTATSAIIWVGVPTLNAANTTISVYYKNNTAVGSGQNASGVWGSTFGGVWHMSQNPAGTAPQIKDSTPNGNNGTTNGSMTLSQQVAGQINGSLKFNTTSDFINVSRANSLEPATAITVSAWVYWTNSNTNYAKIVSKTPTTNVAPYISYALEQNGTGRNIDAGVNVNGTSHEVTAGSITLNAWHYLAMTWNSGSAVKVYIDGALSANSSSLSGNITYYATPMRIAYSADSQTNCTFNGTIDEVELSNVARSAQWINQSYQMQLNNSRWVATGAEQARPS